MGDGCTIVVIWVRLVIPRESNDCSMNCCTRLSRNMRLSYTTSAPKRPNRDSASRVDQANGPAGNPAPNMAARHPESQPGADKCRTERLCLFHPTISPKAKCLANLRFERVVHRRPERRNHALSEAKERFAAPRPSCRAQIMSLVVLNSGSIRSKQPTPTCSGRFVGNSAATLRQITSPETEPALVGNRKSRRLSGNHEVDGAPGANPGGRPW